MARAMKAAMISGGRLHVQHGPIDLVIGVDGNQQAGFAAAVARFDGILQGLVDELEALRHPMDGTLAPPAGETAQRMHEACLPYVGIFHTRMAAVAGAVADTVLAAILPEGPRRAYVNNGGDIAYFLAEGESFRLAMQDHRGGAHGTLDLPAGRGGVATSGRHGRSLSLGIADGVTVVAGDAAGADIAATLIANAVDLPDHPAITRQPARALRDDSDLGARLVPTSVGDLTRAEVARALAHGAARAADFPLRGAALFLRDQYHFTGDPCFTPERTNADARDYRPQICDHV